MSSSEPWKPRSPRERWGTCCPHDPKCEHSYLDDDMLVRWMETPIDDDEAAAVEDGTHAITGANGLGWWP